ncbi:hypothetical protein LMTR3_21815 [Bradyrhizobium sp. LMTR 3]|nr:hypothetical protein LMTR3_21815 [Bradyrhizobium sp. LMTR 3]
MSDGALKIVATGQKEIPQRRHSEPDARSRLTAIARRALLEVAGHDHTRRPNLFCLIELPEQPSGYVNLSTGSD